MVKIVKGKYEAKLEFQRGGGVQTKKTSVGGVLSFFEKQHITRPFEETKISTSVQRSTQITSFAQLLCWSSNDSTPQIEGIGWCGHNYKNINSDHTILWHI